MQVTLRDCQFHRRIPKVFEDTSELFCSLESWRLLSQIAIGI
jgi:hypothetical protein